MGMARGLSDGLLRLCNGVWKDLDGDAVDIVEVVRCKDCIQYNTDGCANGFGWCEVCDDVRMDNDFCSFGAKMDGDGNDI